MKFSVLYRTAEDRRAPEFPNLEDYEDAGIVEASSRAGLVSLLSQTVEISEISEIERKRALRSGDIVKDEQDQAFIMTPSGHLATVTFAE